MIDIMSKPPLIEALGKIPYNLASTYPENEDNIRENFPEVVALLGTEFSSPSSTMTIYYPYAEELIPVTYSLFQMVNPKVMLETISNFYQRDLDDEAINWLVQNGLKRDDFVKKKAFESLESQVFFEGLTRYEKGWLVMTGS